MYKIIFDFLCEIDCVIGLISLIGSIELRNANSFVRVNFLVPCFFGQNCALYFFVVP